MTFLPWKSESETGASFSPVTIVVVNGGATCPSLTNSARAFRGRSTMTATTTTAIAISPMVIIFLMRVSLPVDANRERERKVPDFPRSDVVQPIAVAWLAAMQGRLEDLLHLGGDWAGLARADFAIVQLYHRGYLGGGAGHEGFVGDIERVAGEIFLAHFDRVVAQDFDHRVARDSGQHRRQRRRPHDSVPNDEHVLAAALGHEALGVEQERFVVAVAASLIAGEDRVDVMAGRLRRRHHRVVMEPHER